MTHRTVTLGSIAKITSGGTPDRNNSGHWNGPIPWAKTAQIQNCTITAKDIEEWITQDGLDQSAAKIVPKGTILMAMYGQGKTRGQVAILELDAAINQACAAIQVRPGVDRDYVYQQLRFRYESIRSISNIGGQENLNADLIREIAFALPELGEQEAIARRLAAWDTAIEKAERLIAAKTRWTGALTTRLYRLSDFNGKPMRLGDFLSESTVSGASGRHARKLSIKLYGKGVVAKEERRQGSEETRYFIRRAGQLVYSKLDFLNGAFGIVPPELDGYESTLDLPAFDISPSINPVWLLGYLTRPAYYTRQVGLARGQRKARRVHSSDLLASSLHVPSRALQNQIATVTAAGRSDIDTTIRLFESLKSQKRGLMQKLLTGQWRVKVPEPETA